ncbi:transposase [Baekduia sp. Peel2402]|uniref:transposase n=1 Tax=Baekduia sp. Peel2402 TaxID=3458296 RepID=UPI00403EC725
MTPELDVWEEELRRRPNGSRKTSAPLYSPHELEAMEAWRRIVGVTTAKDARTLLCSDLHAADREALGFTTARKVPTRGNPDRFRMAGVPSEATMSRYRTRVGYQRRADLWARFLARLREDWVAGSGDEARIAHLDGFNMPIQGLAPVIARKTGEVVNADAITVPDAGYQSPYNNGRKGGHGFNNVCVWDGLGVPIAHRLVPMQHAENRTAVTVLDDLHERLGGLRERFAVGVLSADAAFASGDVRRAARRAGYVENIHEVSHGDKPESFKRAQQYAGRNVPIQGYDNWFVNGHRELACACGQGTQERDAWREPDGTARVRLKGRCVNCGSASLLSGRWRRALNPTRFVPMLPGDGDEHADLALGNPLTYNDRMANEYGRQRFGRGESPHGILKTKYKLNTRRRYRSRAEVELETNLVFALIVSLAIQNREHENTTAAATGPPVLPLAA